jgi:hypothetical protein
MQKGRRRTFEVSGVMLLALCGMARGQVLSRQDSPRERTPRIPPPPNADSDSNEMRVAPVIVCFADGTDPRYVAAIERLVKQRNDALFAGLDYFTSTRWSGTVGSPVTIRWSFIPDGVSISSGAGEPVSNSTLFATFDAAFSSQGGRTIWANRFVQAFARWSQLSGNVYTRIRSGSSDWDDGAAWGTAGSAGLRGDVRIGGHPIDGASGILAYNYFPLNGDMVLDTNDAVGFFSIAANQHRAMRNVIMHEHGHGTGLQHSCSINANILMYPSTSGSPSYDGPQQDDIRGEQSLYGDVNGVTVSIAQATDLGRVSAYSRLGPYGVTPLPTTGVADANSSVLSIDPASTSDSYKITTDSPVTLSVAVAPIGSSYQNAAQAGDGSCPTTGTANALAARTLGITILGSDGTTQMGTASAPSAGLAVSIDSVGLPTPGVYYIQVSAAAGSGVQSYTLSIAAGFCHANCDGSTLAPVLNLQDFVCFINEFRAASALSTLEQIASFSNCDGSVTPPVLNAADFTCFLNAFRAGCQ